MSSFKGTAALGALVVGIAGYTFWEYKKASRDIGNSPNEKKLFTFTADQVDQVKLVRNGETVLLTKEGGDWKMKQPVEDMAESSAIDAFLYSLGIQKGKDFRADDENKATKWVEYGLEPAGTVLEVSSGKKTENLQISSKNAFDGSYYVRQGDQLMLGDHGLAQVIGRDTASLRSHRLWREKDATIERVQVELAMDKIKDKFTLIKAEKWTVEPKPAFVVDEGKISQWVEALEKLNPSGIESESLSEEDKRKTLLLKPSLQALVTFKKADGSKGEWQLTAGQDLAEDVFMNTNQRSTVYKSARTTLDSIRVPREYFRDGKRAFKIPVEQAHEIQITVGDFKHKIVKDGINWKLAEGEKNFDLNTEKLTSLLQNLNSLEAQEFLPAGEAKGVKASQRLVIRDDKGKVLADVSWGDEYKAKKSWNKAAALRFVKSSLETDAMGVMAAKITALIDKTMITPKAENKKADNK